MGNHPVNNEHLFLDLIEKGYIYPTTTGEVWRFAIKHLHKKVVSVKPRRAERVCTNGYNQIRTKINGTEKSCMSHRLIWIYYYGDIPNGYEVNHKDGNKLNNNICNLELLTCGDNQRHAFKIGLRARAHRQYLCRGEIIQCKYLKKKS